MTRGTCATCAFFVDAKGECRLNPPTVVVTGIQQPKFHSRWPSVDGDDWCSGWKSGLVGGRHKTNPEQLSEAE